MLRNKGCLIVLALFMLFVCLTSYVALLPTVDKIDRKLTTDYITGKFIKADLNGQENPVWQFVHDNGEIEVLQNTNDPTINKSNASEIATELSTGFHYVLEVRGLRSGFINVPRNIIRVIIKTPLNPDTTE